MACPFPFSDVGLDELYTLCTRLPCTGSPIPPPPPAPVCLFVSLFVRKQCKFCGVRTWTARTMAREGTVSHAFCKLQDDAAPQRRGDAVALLGNAVQDSVGEVAREVL